LCFLSERITIDNASISETVRNKIQGLPQGGRLVLFIVEALVLEVQVYDFLCAHCFKAGTDKLSEFRVERPVFVEEMRVHCAFLSAMLQLYVGHSYSDSFALMQKRTELFFKHNQAVFDNVPVGLFTSTCVTGNLLHVEIEKDLQNNGIHGSTPVLVKANIQKLKILVDECHSLLCDFVKICTNQTIYRPDTDNTMPISENTLQSSLHVVFVEQKLRRIIHVMKNELCGKYNDELALYVHYLSTLLDTEHLHCRHANFLLCLLHLLSVKMNLFL